MTKGSAPTDEHTVYDNCEDYPLLEQASSGTVIPPNLTHRGFLFPWNEPDEGKIALEHRQLICSIFSKRTRTFGQIVSVLLKTKKTKAINTSFNCGYLKHFLEEKIQVYLTTGELIAAGIICEFHHKTKNDQTFLNINMKSLEASITLHNGTASTHG